MWIGYMWLIIARREHGNESSASKKSCSLFWGVTELLPSKTGPTP
jgi:hypothetical protein